MVTANLQIISIKVVDCLEQIYLLNELIAVKKQSDEPAMARQYEHLREQFYEKLKTALAENFDIAADLHHQNKQVA